MTTELKCLLFFVCLSSLNINKAVTGKEVGLGGSVGYVSDLRLGGRGFEPCQGRQHSFMEIGHEIFSTVILSLPLIQDGQLCFWLKNVHDTS